MTDKIIIIGKKSESHDIKTVTLKELLRIFLNVVSGKSNQETYQQRQ